MRTQDAKGEQGGRRRTTRVAGAALAALVGLSASTGAQQPVGVIAGTVSDSAGDRLVGAELFVDGTRINSFSDDTGGYRLLGVPTGTALVRVRRLGYTPTTIPVGVDSGAVARRDVRLTALPLRVEPVIVEASRQQRYTGWAADFYRRLERGRGRFITREDIDRRNSLRVTDLLRTLPGVTIRSTGMASNVPTFRGQRCAPFVWIDGTPAMNGYVDVDAFAPQTLEGIEVYPSAVQVPAELTVPRDKMSCGMIVLWSRVPELREREVASSRYSSADLSAMVASLRVYTADQVDTPARADAEGPVAPQYPAALRAGKVSGEVVVEFVVGTGGRAEMDTFGVVSSDAQEFVEAVRTAVAQARFVPAVREGRVVRQVVQLPVSFAAET